MIRFVRSRNEWAGMHRIGLVTKSHSIWLSYAGHFFQLSWGKRGAWEL